MPTTISQQYDHPTVTLKIEGEASIAQSPTDLSSISRSLTLQLEIQQQETVHLIQGDHQMLSDLLSVLDRYLNHQLQGQPQGSFNGSVAIRPLDFIYHRLTARQGGGIAQVDLSMTQLYDLLEALEEARQALPQLPSLQEQRSSAPAWYAQPPAIAALLIAGVGLVAAATVFSSRTQETRQAAQSDSSIETIITAPESRTAGDPPEPSLRSADQPGDDGNQDGTTGVSDDPAQDDQASDRDDSAQTQELASQPSSEAGAPAAPGATSTEPGTANPLDSQQVARQQAERETSPAESRLSEIGSSLETRLADTWQAPADLESPLSYKVIVDSAGEILAAQPQDQVSETQREITPLADLQTIPEEDLPQGTESFLVVLTPDSQVSVMPQ